MSDQDEQFKADQEGPSPEQDKPADGSAAQSMAFTEEKGPFT